MAPHIRTSVPLGVLTAISLICAIAVAPAQADDHPPILTFTAQRVSGAAVSFAGRYAVWSDTQQTYVKSDDVVSVDQYVKDYAEPWDSIADETVNDDGTFSGSILAFPETTLRASVLHFENLEFSTIAASTPVTLPYNSAMPVRLNAITKYQKNPKSPAYIQAEVDPACIEDPVDTFQTVFCPLTENVILQSKIKGKWKQVGVYQPPTPAENSYTKVIKITHPKGKYYRLYLPGSQAYQKSYSEVFKTSSKRSLN